MNRRLIAFSLSAALLALAAALLWDDLRPRPAAAFDAPGLETPVTRDGAAENGFRIAPAMLGVVYDAFGQTDEAAIYDRLAEVAAGDALEALYLERVGAMAGGGLTQSDQEIHEMELISLSTRPEGEELIMDATWRVIGTVGHAEHMHVRGNTYTADLRVTPVDGSWRFTGFTLRDVDRSDAGEFIPAEQKGGGDWWAAPPAGGGGPEADTGDMPDGITEPVPM